MNITDIQGNTVDVSRMTTATVVEHYNQFARALGEAEVSRFANRSKADSRLVGIADRYWDPQRWEDAEDEALCNDAELDPEVGGADEPITVRLADEPAPGEPVPAEPAVRLSEADQRQIAAEAEDRKAVAPAAKAPRWAVPKREQAADVAYRPRKGSSQAAMYALLTQPDGILVEDFCAQMRTAGFKDKTLHAPASVWSCLRYLFVTSKGYGLDFDGQRIRLLVPANEREVPTKKA